VGQSSAVPLWGPIAIVVGYVVSPLVGVDRQYTGTSGKVDNAMSPSS